MNKKTIELRRKLTEKLKEARELIEAGKIEEGQKATKEAQEIEEQMQDLEKTVSENNEVVNVEDETRAKPKKVETRAALVKFLQGKSLSKEERDVLVETTSPSGGQNSVAVIIPQDIYTEINELKRQYKPLKQFVDVQPTSTNSGSFVYENGDTIEPFVDITEATEIGEMLSPTLKQQKFAITDKGGILPISNTLLADEKGGLVNYINKWIARKSTITDNRKILSVLKDNGIQLTASTHKEIKTAINTKLDPELLAGAVIITNQNGFNIMDNWVDATGKPILQPNPQDATKKMLSGMNIEVYANTNIPDEEEASPVYIGNLQEAIKFMDREEMALAVSKEAGFTKNLTLIRAIQRDDVVTKDTKAYLNIKLTAPKEEPTIYVKTSAAAAAASLRQAQPTIEKPVTTPEIDEPGAEDLITE